MVVGADHAAHQFQGRRRSDPARGGRPVAPRSVPQGTAGRNGRTAP